MNLKSLLIGLLYALGISIGVSTGQTLVVDDSFVVPPHLMITRESLTAKSLSVQCGTGSVVITFADTSVVFTEGCNPNEAAKEFWKQVNKAGLAPCKEEK